MGDRVGRSSADPFDPRERRGAAGRSALASPRARSPASVVEKSGSTVEKLTTSRLRRFGRPGETDPQRAAAVWLLVGLSGGWLARRDHRRAGGALERGPTHSDDPSFGCSRRENGDLPPGSGCR